MERDSALNSPEAQILILAWNSTGHNPKSACVFKDKISNIENTRISCGLRMAVSVGCM